MNRVSVSILPGTIGTEQLASLLGISRQRINTLARQEVIPKIGRGKFDPVAAVSAYCAWLRENHERKSANDELQQEKVRLTREQADKAALANEQTRGLLVPAKEVEAAWTAFCVDLRAKILAMPARISGRAGLSRETTELVDSELRLALGDLADGR